MCGIGMKSEDDYRAEDDARTMMRAAEIHGDSKRLKAAHGHIKKQHRAFRKATRVLSRGKGR